jgi:hypothetical protein
MEAQGAVLRGEHQPHIQFLDLIAKHQILAGSSAIKDQRTESRALELTTQEAKWSNPEAARDEAGLRLGWRRLKRKPQRSETTDDSSNGQQGQRLRLTSHHLDQDLKHASMPIDIHDREGPAQGKAVDCAGFEHDELSSARAARHLGMLECQQVVGRADGPIFDELGVAIARHAGDDNRAEGGGPPGLASQAAGYELDSSMQ